MNWMRFVFLMAAAREKWDLLLLFYCFDFCGAGAFCPVCVVSRVHADGGGEGEWNGWVARILGIGGRLALV